MEIGILSLLPPIVAIALALYTKKVLPSLFLGIWIGGLLVANGNPIAATTTSLDWVVQNGSSSWNITILLFAFVIGGGVGVLYKSGSIRALGIWALKRVKSSRVASVVAAILGCLVFVDDYVNTVVVGNAMRDISDELRVSREKLSYIVDSTAAPVSGLFIFSTWIGFLLGLIGNQFDELGIDKGEFAIYLKGIPYQFYAIGAIILVFLVASSRRNYGPMLRAEYRARKTGKVVDDDATPMLETESTLGEVSEDIKGRAWVFVASILTLVAVSIVGIWTSGGGMDYYAEEGLMGVFGNAAVVQSLLYASFAMLVVATVAAFGYRQLDIEEWIGSIENGFKIMLKPVLILLLAWTIGTATGEVGTAEYVVGLAEAAGIGALLVPLIVFVISAFIAFTTGTSWGTFGIMIPMAIPMAYSLSGDVVGVAVWASIASVFSGGIMGDHCSPISDTTIMSSMFTGSDHVDHVNTQIPYALTVAGAAVVSLSLLAAGLTMWYVLLPLSWILIVLAFFFLSNWYGKKEGIPGGKVPIYYGPDDELKDDPTAEHDEEAFDFKGEETEEEEGFVDELAEEEQEMMEDSDEPEP